MKKQIKDQFKKNKLIFILPLILILLGASGLIPASLYGGDSDNVYGGEFSVSETGQYGNIITNFAETTVTQIDFLITNNANAPKTITPDSNTHKQVVTITSVADSTDHQVEIEVPYDSEMETDFSDIRFQLTDGTDLSQWRETYTESTTATWWIKTDLLTGDNDIVMTYGNDLPLKSEADNVFELYLDGNNAIDNSKWTTEINYGNDKVDIVDDSGNNVIRIYCDQTTTDSNVYLNSIPTFNYDVIYEYKHKFVSNGHDGNTRSSFYFEKDSTNIAYKYDYLSNWKLSGNGLDLSTDIGNGADTSWTNYKIIHTSSNIKTYIDETLQFDASHTQQIGGISFRGWAENIDYYDDIIVRKYMSFEPSISFGTPTTITYDFTKQQIVTLDNTGGSVLTDYHMPVTVTFDADMQPEMDDVRFAYTNDVAISSYPISVTDSTSAVFDIEVDIPADSTLDIVMLYGNDEVNACEPTTLVGYALPLGSSKYVNLGSYGNAFGIVDEFAYECDVYIPSLDVATIRVLDLGYRAGTSNDYNKGLHLYIGSSGRILYRVQQNSANAAYGDAISNRGIWDSTAYADVGWTHIKVTRTNSEAKVYLDGVLEDTLSFSGSSLNYWQTRKHRIGTSSSALDDVISGYSPDGTIIRNVKIYNDADATNLVAQWDIDEGTGTDVIDLVGSVDGTVVGASWSYISGSSEPAPLNSFGSEQSFVNPTIEVVATGDSNSQQYEAEIKEFSIIPTSDISSFAINTDAIDFDFDAVVHYTGATSISAQNATEGTMTFAFTPDIAIESGFANAIFSENVTIENPEISATLDDIAVDSVFENDTVSIILNNVDTSEHTVNVTISQASVPSTPSSGGSGGGSSYIAPVVVEENETETIMPEITTENAPITKEDLTFGIENENMFIIVFAVLVVIIFGMFKLSKK